MQHSRMQLLNYASPLILSAILVVGCSRSTTENDSSVHAIDEPAAESVGLGEQPISIPIASRVRTAEDERRLWLPPINTSLNKGEEVPLSEIRAVVSQAREQADTALASNDLQELAAAQTALLQAQRSIYALAVRMRSKWTKMEYQSFLADLSFHQILDLSSLINLRQSTLAYEARLWAGE
ncbi:MAG: hypothetical protein EA402_05220 [Planctomycetota bacterium]|nr:MAG: hypothetical protein EA402_05220 [Planctomycetota bacterium]